MRILRALFRPVALAALLVSGTAASGSASHAAEARKVIVDDDGSGIAEWMLLQAPNVDVLGITILSGDVWRDEGVAHALRAVEIAHRTDVPVLRGAVYPLLNSEKLTDRWEALYGKLVWKGAWMKKWVEPTVQSTPPYHAPDVVPHLPEGDPTIKASDEPAVMFMIRKVHEFPGQVTIVATGPMTDLALAQRLDPSFASLAKELVYMGGSLNPQQVRPDVAAAQFAREFANSPRREFNFRFDPEAASIVLRAPWRHIVAVPADPSTATELTPEFLHKLAAANPAFAGTISKREPGFPLWDEIAAAVWLDPSLITRSEELYVDVNSQFGAGYGDTLSWTPGYQPDLDEQRETVVRTIDAPKLEAFITSLLARPLPNLSPK
ncbi:nucleoside hydrolase [Acetobacter sacchari]|uniref:Nucleoside hydrolase n=1 Tax=Acetobacter sacchari TaxID=2661687 RepID=A0ABS3LZP6_9PROT|nr:nucleoside hydrolase [Acetobacter sacchari]MBO1361379.1 nucleoside hydrolase [Acetobacter sacchari]